MLLSMALHKVKFMAIAAVTVFFFLVIGGFVYSRVIRSHGIPDYSGSIFAKGISGKAAVARNSFAVPHVFAENESGLYFATGYAMAQDRLFQMDMRRRAATGRLSEVFGRSLIDTDLLMLSMKITEKAKAMLKDSEPEILMALSSFSRGVNKYIEANTDNLPLEFSHMGYKPYPWTPLDSAAIIAGLGATFSSSINFEYLSEDIHSRAGSALYADLFPLPRPEPAEIKKEILTDLFAMAIEASDPAERFMPRVFSPGIFWAVSDQLSDSEKPILSGFAHDNGSAPCGWYAIGQTMPLAKSKKNAASSDYANNAEKTETAIEASGFAIPGVPFIVCGRNSDITWFLTGTFDDTFDIFIEKTGPKKNYLNEGKWTALVQKKFKIRVRGGNIEERAALYTSRGPIIAGPDKKTGYALSAAWTGFSQENPLRSLYAIGRAANNGDFTSALRGIKSFCVDAIYADKYGNIGAYRAGGIPMRTSGDGSLALPGWKNRTGWNGIYPYETLPMNYNPPDGFLITASAAARENMGTLKPEILKASDISWIRDALRSKNSRSINGLLSIHKETKSGFASFIKPGLLKIIKDSKNLTPIEKTALEIVEKWDTRMNDSSDGAALFSAFIDSFSNNIFKTRLGDCIYERIDSEFDIRMLIAALWGNEKSGWFRPKSEGKSGFSDCVQKSFSDAVKKLSGDQSKWSSGIKTDAFYRHALGHSWLRDKFLWLNIGPEPVSGLYANSSTGPAGFPVINYSCGLGEGSAYLALSSGTCGVPASAHYSDQTEVLTRGRSIRIPLKKEESLKKAKYVLNISPAK